MNKEKQNGVPVKSRFRTYRELNPASTANHTIPGKLLIFLYLGVYTHKMGIDKSTCLIELLVSIQGVNLCKILTVFYSAFANSKHVCIHQLLFTSQKIYWKETILFCQETGDSIKKFNFPYSLTQSQKIFKLIKIVFQLQRAEFQN